LSELACLTRSSYLPEKQTNKQTDKLKQKHNKSHELALFYSLQLQGATERGFG
jgi:hypothetical protein